MPKRKAEYDVHTCCVCETEIQVEECVYWPLRYGTRGKRLHLYLHSKCRKTFVGQIEDRKAAAARAAAKSAITSNSTISKPKRPNLVEELTKSGPPGPPEAPDQHVPPEAPHLKPDPFSREERLRLVNNLIEELGKAPSSMDLLHFQQVNHHSLDPRGRLSDVR